MDYYVLCIFFIIQTKVEYSTQRVFICLLKCNVKNIELARFVWNTLFFSVSFLRDFPLLTILSLEPLTTKQAHYIVFIRANCSALFVGGTLPSTCSTPPPPFDDAVRSNDQTLASGGQLQQGAPTTMLASSLSTAQSKQNKVVHHVTLTKTYHDAVRWVNRIFAF